MKDGAVVIPGILHSRFDWAILPWEKQNKSDHLIDTEWRIYASVNYAIIGSNNGLLR